MCAERVAHFGAGEAKEGDAAVVHPFFLAEAAGEQGVFVGGEGKRAAGLEDAGQAGDGGGAGVGAGDVFEDLAGDDAVEGAVGEGQAAEIGLD